MLKRLSIIEDVFRITGRGLVVVPGIPWTGEWRIKIGTPLELRCPDGSKFSTAIRGIEMVRGQRQMCPLLLGAELTKDDVPIGTEIWIDAPGDPTIDAKPNSS